MESSTKNEQGIGKAVGYPNYEQATLPSDLNGLDYIWDYGFASIDKHRTIHIYEIMLQNTTASKPNSFYFDRNQSLGREKDLHVNYKQSCVLPFVCHVSETRLEKGG